MKDAGCDMMLPGFSWLLERWLAGCGYPRSAAALAYLAEQGIQVIINLHELPHDRYALAAHRIAGVHLPVPDFSPPSSGQIQDAVSTIEHALCEGKPVAVHCGAGLGRTGTILACYLVRMGCKPADAMARVRALRPGSIETAAQEVAIVAYAEHIRAK
ncbi:MAG: dual specificity protein phosphatase family protein [Chloroflexi bacterium]|nr:dual specificity protein phosphatase family protein [Chloroflexota bacterium]